MLIGIIGELGAGKTLTLTYLAYKNHLEGETVYSNYWLSFISETHIIFNPLDLEKITGFLALDELWYWLDARASSSRKNRIISTLLLKSRKLGQTVAFTQQYFRQIDRRIRAVLDVIMIPELNEKRNICKVEIYDGSFTPIKKIKFDAKKIYPLYNTNETPKTMHFADWENYIIKTYKNEIDMWINNNFDYLLFYLYEKIPLSKNELRAILKKIREKTKTEFVKTHQ